MVNKLFHPIRISQIVMIVLALSGCGVQPVEMPATTLSITSSPSATKMVESERIVITEYSEGISTNTYKEIIDQAEVIIIGKVTDTGFTYNSARRGDNIHEPHPTFYTLSKIYEVDVNRYLKGDGPDRFYISYSVGMTSGQTPEEITAKLEIGDFDYKGDPLQPEKTYLMFLNPWNANDLYPEIPNGVYYHQTAPGIFDITDPQEVKLVYFVGGFLYDFRIPLEELINYIQNPELIPPTPTPVTEPIYENPYP